ncbi:MAG: PEP-CTERM sorting domain-containing protein [Acidobacteriaceae bacterium]
MTKCLAYLTAAVLLALPACASKVTLNFTGATNQQGSSVQTFYQRQYGITFSSSAMVWNSYLYNPGIPNSDFSYVDPGDANCASNDGHGTCTSLKAPFSDNVVMQGVLGGPRYITMNAPNGIAGYFSFQIEGSNNNNYIDFYSGLNGTGRLIRELWIPKTGTHALKIWSNEIALDPIFRIQIYNAVAQSVVFDQGRGYNGSGSGYIEYDNISYTQPDQSPAGPYYDGGPTLPDTPVPEPGSLALLFSGFLAGTVVIRRRFDWQ